MEAGKQSRVTGPQAKRTTNLQSTPTRSKPIVRSTGSVTSPTSPTSKTSIASRSSPAKSHVVNTNSPKGTQNLVKTDSMNKNKNNSSPTRVVKENSDSATKVALEESATAVNHCKLNSSGGDEDKNEKVDIVLDTGSPEMKEITLEDEDEIPQSGTDLSINLQTDNQAVLNLQAKTPVATPGNGFLHCGGSQNDTHSFNSNSSPSVCCELRPERTITMAEVKEQAFNRLQCELEKAQKELKLKDEEVVKLSRIRDEVGSELEDLTASLFQEAHKMVREANVKQANCEKLLKEAEMKIEVLEAEVKALKELVSVSTPSAPTKTKSLLPFLETDDNTNSAIKFLRGHRRSPSHNNLRYGRETPQTSPVKESPERDQEVVDDFNPDNYEIDPVFHKEFVSWRETPGFDQNHPLLSRIYKEDILPALTFTNHELSLDVLSHVEQNSINIEMVSAKSTFPKKCVLSDAPRLCKYRMRLGDGETWHYISQLCRNRIAAVCDMLTYLRYIQDGLVKSGVYEVYWEVIRLRRQVAHARLGIQ